MKERLRRVPIEPKYGGRWIEGTRSEALDRARPPRDGDRALRGVLECAGRQRGADERRPLGPDLDHAEGFLGVSSPPRAADDEPLEAEDDDSTTTTTWAPRSTTTWSTTTTTSPWSHYSPSTTTTRPWYSSPTTTTRPWYSTTTTTRPSSLTIPGGEARPVGTTALRPAAPDPVEASPVGTTARPPDARGRVGVRRVGITVPRPSAPALGTKPPQPGAGSRWFARRGRRGPGSPLDRPGDPGLRARSRPGLAASSTVRRSSGG